MADLKPKKINLAEINGGVQYEKGDGIQQNAINDPIQASAYAQALATNTPDTTKVGLIGTPSVKILEKSDGTPQFEFAYLKGATGARLVSRVLQGEDQDGGNIYLDTFDDGTTAYFTAPRGRTADKISDWMGKDPIGDNLHFIYYDGEKFVARHVEIGDYTTDWEQIALMSQQISRGEKTPEELGLAVGQERRIELTTGEVVDLVILGFNHDLLASGAGYAGITFGMKNLLATTYEHRYIQGDKYKSMTYVESIMANTILPDIANTLPQELREVMKNVVKPCCTHRINETPGVGMRHEIKENADAITNIFLLSIAEITNEIASSDGTIYDYYKSNPMLMKKLRNGYGSYHMWGVRTLLQYENNNPSIYAGLYNLIKIDADGEVVMDNALNANYGICFAFCV